MLFIVLTKIIGTAHTVWSMDTTHGYDSYNMSSTVLLVPLRYIFALEKIRQIVLKIKRWGPQVRHMPRHKLELYLGDFLKFFPLLIDRRK